MSEHSEAAERLSGRLSDLLCDTLGAYPFGRHKMFFKDDVSPTLVGVISGGVYLAVFAVAPWVLLPHPLDDQTMSLIWLSVWGGCYLAFAVAMARFASAEATHLIEHSILPRMSAAAIEAIDEEIARRFSRGRIGVVSCIAAALATLASVIAIRQDLASCAELISAQSFQIAFCCGGYFILFLTAARATYVARFYSAFAANLGLDADRVFPLDPARSALVTPITWLGRHILLFWFAIACSVATLLVMYWFGHLKWFVLLVVPTATFFSMGVGAVVFLANERRIRHTVDGVTARALDALELELKDLFEARASLDETGWKRFTDLTAIRTSIVSDGWYQSVRLGVISVVAPFLGPAVALLAILFKHES